MGKVTHAGMPPVIVHGGLTIALARPVLDDPPRFRRRPRRNEAGTDQHEAFDAVGKPDRVPKRNHGAVGMPDQMNSWRPDPEAKGLQVLDQGTRGLG